jgi:uncharacterized tellurite resistance protein B-like protein
MLDRLISFFGSLQGEANRNALSSDDPRVAAAALMIHVIDADGVRDDAERTQLREALASAYGVAGHELDTLVSAGEEAEREAVDLFAFTSVLNRALDAEAKVEFIGILWEMVYADGERHELEDNIVWRVAELIGVAPRDRMLMRQRVRDTGDESGNG